MPQTQKKLLYEVSIIRPLVIFLLVIYHAICIYGGDWQQIPGVEQVDAYWWIEKIISGFRIETIAFIAGYVFAFQCIDLGKRYDFKPFAIKKFRRLIIPSLFFGTLYYFCFYYSASSFSVSKFVLSITSGAGHLWFLPMLFWCFLIMWAIDHYKLNRLYTIIVLAVCSVLPIPYIPFGITRVFHFIFYFFIGYVLWINKGRFLKISGSVKYLIVLWGGYLCIRILDLLLSGSLQTAENIPFLHKLGVLVTNNAFHLASCVTGILALYITTLHFTSREGFRPRQWVIWSSSVCYGVYVYHQFILKYLYYDTNFPMMCNRYMLPWTAAFITLAISIGCTVLTLKTKLGREMIG